MAKVIQLEALGDEMRKALESTDEEIKSNANKAVRVALIKTWGKIIRMTPVDTGRARSNWFVDLRAGDDTNTVNKQRGPSYINKNLPDDLFNNKVYLYNNLPYIRALEYGHSTQAPLGMVRVSLMGWGRALKKAFKAVQ